ncbi:hypothetical protein NQT69_07500 [Pseudoalteromonas shioyasakiensis]|uniref:hypothetical protein n=1 Tax=Pseudoalteromonas shioyasakiensis TaxID=1190813 RepID=UPI002117916F|nr:hypothetical protein [Pseudoalteromonas shioyasakiensis]MCQ8877841.1 hypothetical protein [Pseudoalteromonas shioyasakiensis]
MVLKQQLFLLQQQKNFWLIMALFITIIAANTLSFFNATNAFFYSQITSLTHSQYSDVVLIESEHLSREHTDLIKQLQTYEPSKIIVVSNEQLTLNTSVITKNQDTIFYPHPNNDYCLPTINDWAGYNVEIKIHANAHCDSIWPVLFQHSGADSASLINFALSPSALPKFTATRLMTMDIMASQLQNKIIIVGQKNAGLGVTLNAPKISQSTNYLLLVAYIADTLQKENAITSLKEWQSTLLFLLIAIALLFAFQKLSINYSLVLTTLLSLVWVGTGYLMLSIQQIFLPIGQMMIVSLYTLIWVIIVRKLNEDKELANLIGNIQQKMIGRYLPKSFTSQSSPWDSIIHLVNQQLALNKSIFLARKEGDHRLTEIRAVNCQLTDIKEMRRDYKRPPYSDALKAFSLVKIERPFFEKLDDGEVQYIVPLTYAGDVRGFWAMTVTPNENFNQQAFEKNVNAFAAQVGELLFHYRIFESQAMVSNSTLSQLLTLKLQEPLSQKVKTSIAEMEQKLTTLEHVFNHIRSATVLFNLFGQVVQINKSLEELASRYHFSIFEMTALDLLCQVTNLDIETAKGKLRYLTLQKGEAYLEAKLGDQLYILNVRAMDSSSIQSASGEPFQVSGILFEFIDIAFFIDKMPNSKQLCDALNEKQQRYTKSATE